MNNILKYILTLISIGIFLLIFANSIVLPIITKKSSVIYLPDVRNMNIIKAKQTLYDLGFEIETSNSSYSDKHKPNEVVSMLPRAFSKVKKGRKIKLKIAGNKEDVIMGDLINKSFRNAQILLDRKKLLLDTLIYEYSTDYGINMIIDQYPKPSKVLKSFDKVTLIVSLGNPPDYYIVPNLINTNLKRAKSLISKSGLILGEINYIFTDDYLNNTVLDQDITENMKLSFPSIINLTVSTDRINNE